MIYFFVIYSILSAVFCLILLLNNVKIRTNLKFVEENFAKCDASYNELTIKNIEYIRKNEQLSREVEYQKKLIENFNSMKNDLSESTKAVLFDLGTKLSQQLIETNKKENKEIYELSEKTISNSVDKFNKEFERLSNMISTFGSDVEKSRNSVEFIKNSLLSPSAVRSFAEITLENILKSLSLRQEVDFFMQYHIVGEHNNILRPDAIVFLPNDNAIIIDAKTSKFLLEHETDQEKLTKMMNRQLQSLSSKEYHDEFIYSLKQKGKVAKLVITLMFLPTDHAVEKIYDIDKDFIQKAWDRDIIPVGPAGLISTLSLAKFQISQNLITSNYERIIDEVKKLVSSISSLANHSSKLSDNIASLVSNYDKFAASFNSNFLSKVRFIELLGVDLKEKSKKQQFLDRYCLTKEQK